MKLEIHTLLSVERSSIASLIQICETVAQLCGDDSAGEVL